MEEFISSVDNIWRNCVHEQVCEVFKKELGETPDKVFDEFDPDPIASASLAQVHVAHYVYTPEVHWSLSTSKLLTMEFMDGAQVNDVIAIRRLGMQPSEVSRLASQTFAEMMFKHGLVHCDPHAANLFVRPLPSDKRSIFGKKKPQLILLDHGLYKELDFSTRFSYASLWRALVFSDANGIKEHNVKLGSIVTGQIEAAV
ncbi:hypothetical protein V6N12_012807 [Hibiscus sabdariffa]|uniref:ABC1 atypical kinase-like domain-containing protein n=1 Tax=Hibiscus sabdariffa TaxID=183260 RepID=A0ABR2EFG3_9ROSI